MKDIKKSLEHNNLPILILAIASWYKEKVTILLPPPALVSDSEEAIIYNCVRMVEKFPPSFVNKAYASFFVGSSEHDMILPVDSQLAKHFTSQYIERHTIEGAIHDKLPGFIVPKDQIIYNQPEATKLVFKFVKEHFSFRHLP